MSVTEQGSLTLQRDLNDFIQLNALPTMISISRLDDGSGIASTLQSHGAMYHKSCRSSCNSYRVKRVRDSLENKTSEAAGRSPKKLRSSFGPLPDPNTLHCIICQGDDTNELRKASTDKIDEHLKQWATTTKNWQLFSRLTARCDTHAMDAYYHVQCYLRLRDTALVVERQMSSDEPPATMFDAMVMAQLIALVEESRTGVFKLSELRELYKAMMSEMGRPCSGREPHATRFKDNMLHHLPDWAEFSQGRDIFISHKATVGTVLAQTYHSAIIDQDEALLLVRAAMAIRKRILVKYAPFNGSFSPYCLSEPVDETVLSFVNVVLQGPKGTIHHSRRVQAGSDAGLDTRAKIACTISQLLTYNTVKYASSSDSTAIRHSKERGTPFPLYHGIKLHGDARLKHQIQNAHSLGLSVSYDRVMEVKLQVANAVCKRHAEDGVVLPTNIRLSVFTTHDVDNLDSNKTGNLSRGDFHGTCITATNHLSKDNCGVRRPAITFDHTTNSKPKLSDRYATVPPVEMKNDDVFVPRRGDGKVRPTKSLVSGAEIKDEAWISHVDKGTLDKDDVVTWAEFNSQLSSDESIEPRAEIGILPIFPDKAASACMMKHTMDIVKENTEFINPGQTPVLGADQPLYAICKQLQWQFPDSLGEDKFVMQLGALLGALHIEQKCQQMMGKMLQGSGWDTVLAQADVFSSGRAQSTLSA